MLYYQSISQSNRIPFNITTGKAGDYHKTPVYGTDNTMVEPQIMVSRPSESTREIKLLTVSWYYAEQNNTQSTI